MISSTTSEPSGIGSRIMVVSVAGCRSVRTFRDCHNSNPLQCFARIERGQGADLGKGTFVRGLSV